MDSILRHRTLGFLGQRLLPSTCLMCRNSGDNGVDLCATCTACLSRLDARGPDSELGCKTAVCLGCGVVCAGYWPALWRRDRAGRAWCAACRERLSPFRRIAAPWRYCYPMDGLLSSLKRHRQRSVGKVLGSLLADEVRRIAAHDHLVPRFPDLIVPVPDHPKRRAARGHSPVEDIAIAIADRLDLPLSVTSAVRVVDVGSLSRRSRAERALAIKGAFRVSEDLYGQRVALVDDVLTSGATSHELARECLDAGVASVELWVVARTAME